MGAVASKNCSEPITCSMDFDHCSLVALYHWRNSVKGSEGSTSPARKRFCASSMSFSQPAINPRGSPVVADACFQISMVDPNHIFHISLEPITSGLCFICSWVDFTLFTQD